MQKASRISLRRKHRSVTGFPAAKKHCRCSVHLGGQHSPKFHGPELPPPHPGKDLAGKVSTAGLAQGGQVAADSFLSPLGRATRARWQGLPAPLWNAPWRWLLRAGRMRGAEGSAPLQKPCKAVACPHAFCVLRLVFILPLPCVQLSVFTQRDSL